MSGPKVDVVTIREQESQRLSIARERRKNLANNLLTEIHRISCLDVDGTTNVLLELKKETLNKIQELLESVRKGNELLDCDKINDELKKQLNIFNTAWVKENAYLSKEKSMLEQREQERAQYENQKRLLSSLKREKIQLFSTKVSKELTATLIEGDVSQQVQEFEQDIREFMQIPGVSIVKKNSMLILREELVEISKSSLVLEKKVKRIARMYEDFEQIKAMALREVAEMEFVYNQYVRECFDLGDGVKELSEFSSVAEIEEAIRLGQIAAKESMSKEYIRRQINEVMEKHGYNVVRSDNLMEERTESQVLYGVNDKTGIDVFVSESNQVTMRVVGIGVDDKMSSDENEYLFQQQCSFCSLHPQITEELKMRGVILQTKVHMAPDKKYNKKIKVKGKNTIQSTSRAKKELKRTEKKVMYRE